MPSRISRRLAASDSEFDLSRDGRCLTTEVVVDRGINESDSRFDVSSEFLDFLTIVTRILINARALLHYRAGSVIGPIARSNL